MKGNNQKFIFICGGVMSSIGKGITVASLGRILKSKGFRVTAIKIDPYINYDAGTMNPIEHGEVFVTEDGTECDQDVGNYERFLDENIYDLNYITTGRIYYKVISDERSFKYNGKCVETIPHITDEIIRRIKLVAKKTKADFILVEIGGTVGEYQNLIFLEAGRILKIQQPKDVLFVLVSYLPIPKMVGEMKTKPTQYAVRTLNSAGIQPDIIIARSDYPLDDLRKRKLSIFCNLEEQDIISAPDVNSIYEVPLNFEKDNLGNRILKKFNLRNRKSDLKDWEKLVKKIQKPKDKVRIGIIGKYFKTGHFTLLDSYISVLEAIKHASYYFSLKPEIIWLDSELYEKNSSQLKKDLKNINGVIIPGGFGQRGILGKIKAINYLRETHIPFLGLCLGMQLAIVEFAQNVLKLKNAHSTEFNPNTPNPVIDLMESQKKILKKRLYGGTMRLGAYECEIFKNTKSYKIYKKYPFPEKKVLKNGNLLILERHRHRYEFNNYYLKIFQEKGLVFSGINPQQQLVELIELPSHPFYIASQFHPEFKSRPLRPHPLFLEFIKTSYERK
ncbi:MAG: CTP synthase [Minisyncoccia bacterium]